MSASDDAATCAYTFDPSRHPEAALQTTWDCPHDAHRDSDHCVFHLTPSERASHNVTGDEVATALRETLDAPDPRLTEFVGATLPALSFTYQEVSGETNHAINLQHATVEGLDFTHARLDHGIDLRGATVGSLTFDDADVEGAIEAAEVTVEDGLSATEATFHQDAHFDRATFDGVVNCDEATFEEDTTFEAATFDAPVEFRNVTTRGTSHVLDDHLSFAAAAFRDDASFREADFQYVTFADAAFEASSDFEHATFQGQTRFEHVSFAQTADFDEATFSNDATFEAATFEGVAEFSGAEFSGESRATHDDVTFEAARFAADADFELAQFRFSNFADATFEADLTVESASFRECTDCSGIEVEGDTTLSAATFHAPVTFEECSFDGVVTAAETEFGGDADFEETTFTDAARFPEARFRADASFYASTFRDDAVFRGAAFEGEARHAEENASFAEAAFHALADFRAAHFTSASFWDTGVYDRCDFRESVFAEGGRFHVDAGDADTYVDLTDATLNGGAIVLAAGNVVPYDLTRATIGDVRLDSESDEFELLDRFRFCLTDFDHFDFSNHHSYLERNDWNLHDFVGNAATDGFAVEMTNDVVEETYRKAQDSAQAVGDTPAMREFEFKRYLYNRRKNVDIVFTEYSMNALSRLKKASSVVLNYFMQFSCGYGNRLPRIAALTFCLPVVYGFLYVLGGPLRTQAGNVFTAADPGTVLFDGLYYSYISFSTIGYGDIGPIGWAAKLLAMSQGMLNGLFFTLLTFTLFKRVLGGS